MPRRWIVLEAHKGTLVRVTHYAAGDVLASKGSRIAGDARQGHPEELVDWRCGKRGGPQCQFVGN